MRKPHFELPLHFMLLPPVIIVLIYSYGPILGLVIAFQRYVPAKGISGSEWVGLDQFKYVFSLPDTMNVIMNTLSISVMKLAAGLVVPIAVALMLNEVRKHVFKRLVQTFIYFPYFLSWVLLGGILIDILSPERGVVNAMLGWVGVEPIYFLGDNGWFRYVLVITNEWKEFGFSTIVYLAALTGINPTLYEAAVIDGANRWRQTWHVTLPGIRPIIVLLMTLALGQVLNAGFDQVLNLYSPQVYESGDIIDTMVYRMGLLDAQFSVAAAVGLFKSAISLLLISVAYYLAYRLVHYRIF
ncbi:ABC transporter permease subunit [Paenibacillus sp. J5C_2022]|uniref:ABC transporter permease n=1 Tax=Paenibacillus sp. J5C2022 TaxID=2977129 RepID=UPI0021D2FCDF|nr:ABC transporter permease subunit [Paenibacillus sp. J5C2022]MCU6712193.1 ABC transporter permease subunit [Paenibacillus sp. J5C2022]